MLLRCSLVLAVWTGIAWNACAQPTSARAVPADSGSTLVGTPATPGASALTPTGCVLPEDQNPAAVRRLLDEQVAAWNRGDLAGFMEGYWRSDSLTFYAGGDVVRGWQVTHDRYHRRYQSEGREMGVLVFDLHDVRVTAAGQALVRGAWSLEFEDSRPHGLFTLWLRWFPDRGWRVVHDHSSSAD